MKADFLIFSKSAGVDTVNCDMAVGPKISNHINMDQTSFGSIRQLQFVSSSWN